MELNVLPFPKEIAVARDSQETAVNAEVISLDVYRQRSRKLRTPTGVFFVSTAPRYEPEFDAA